MASSNFERKKSKKAFKELAEMLTDEDLKNVVESSRRFRERFALRSNREEGS